MENLFSRQDVLKMTGLSSGQLSRLDKAGIVQPLKIGSTAHPAVLYDSNQLVELKIIAALRDKLTMNEVKKVLDHIRENGLDKNILEKYLVICEEDLHWVSADESISNIAANLNGKGAKPVILKIVAPVGEMKP